jgi:uncharacterized protein YjiS (DUF1127 family)
MNAPLAKEQIALLMSDSLTYRSPAVEGTEGTAYAPPPRPGLMAALGRAVRALLELPRRRAVIEELSSLSDRELADIGLARADVPHIFVRPSRVEPV